MFNDKIELQQLYGDSLNQNSIIWGDNLKILDSMQSTHSQLIKCVYLDPPYNTGQKFENYDDRVTHEEWIGELTVLLSKIKPLLTDDGSVWISINDNNLHYLKVAADTIFGRENFIHTIVWEHKKSRENRSVFSRNHEYILLYARDATIWKKIRNKIPDSEENLKLYKNVDEKRGLWSSVSLIVPNIKSKRLNQIYEIVSPTGKINIPPHGKVWQFSKQRFEQELKKDNIHFGADGNSVPRFKKFLNERTEGMTPETLWVADDVGTTTTAKKHVISLMEETDTKIFDTPKPEQLISRILQISTNEGDLVLDTFLGSGTTAAVCHKMNRGYIGIEKVEDSISFINKRLQKVINGEKGGISESVGWNIGGGFSFYKLTE